MDKVAKTLLDINAIFLRPNKFFTFTSGLKSPIYCDNRLVLSFPKARTLIADELTKIIKKNYPEVEMLMGVATAGIPHATLIAERLNLPAGYVRGEVKKHGRTNQIEGKCYKGTKVVIVEDLVSTGKSIFEAKNALDKIGANVLGSVAIFTYDVPSVKDKFNKANLSLHTTTDFNSLIKIAIKHNYVKRKDLKIISNWKKEFDKI